MQHGSRNITLPKGSDPLKLSLQDCIDLIVNTPQKKDIASWGDISVMNGPYGPYIKAAGKNYRIPKTVDPQTLTEEKCKEIIQNSKK